MLMEKKEKMDAEIAELKGKGRRDDWLARMERERLDLEREHFKEATKKSPKREREERYMPNYHT